MREWWDVRGGTGTLAQHGGGQDRYKHHDFDLDNHGNDGDDDEGGNDDDDEGANDV